MDTVLIVRDVEELAGVAGRTVVVETDGVDMVEGIRDAVVESNRLFCIKVHTKQEITSIVFREEWREIPLVIYPAGLGVVRDLIGALPVIKKLNVKFFLHGEVGESYEAVRVLSSLGIYSGIVINEHADWERLTDLMYYALCGKVAHAPVEPFQYVYDTYRNNLLVDYERVFFEGEWFEGFTAKDAKGDAQRAQGKLWQRFFYEGTACAACEGWRICMGKYARLEDKTGCKGFTVEWLNLIESIKFKK
jgi:hypothetical protein